MSKNRNEKSMEPYYQAAGIRIFHGSCEEVLRTMPDNSVDSIVTDPPYGLAFMGKKWDYDVPSVEIWEECLRVLKPGGHLTAFAGTRTQHRMAVRIEDAGFEIRDMIGWLYGSGFPKSHDVGKALDKLQGNEREVIGKRSDFSHDGFSRNSSRHNDTEDIRIGASDWNNPVTKGTSEWEGWGTSLKPALEPITVARKPLIGTVAANVLQYGTGGINIDGCRVGMEDMASGGSLPDIRSNNYENSAGKARLTTPSVIKQGRFPANIIHDGSDEVVRLFPESGGGAFSKSGGRNLNGASRSFGAFDQSVKNAPDNYGDSGSAARFFYCAKASKSDRGEGNNHATVKPTALMQYLIRLVTPPGGTTLDPFAGSGSTGKAAVREGFGAILIERDIESVEIAIARISAEQAKADKPQPRVVQLNLFS